MLWQSCSGALHKRAVEGEASYRLLLSQIGQLENQVCLFCFPSLISSFPKH
jgi:hypothetical protein